MTDFGPLPGPTPGGGPWERPWPGPRSICIDFQPGRPILRPFREVPFECIAQKIIPKMGYLSLWGIKVVLRWPSGGPGLCPAPGPPEGHLNTILVPHELRSLS
jgi:hypothetical protein